MCSLLSFRVSMPPYLRGGPVLVETFSTLDMRAVVVVNVRNCVTGYGRNDTVADLATCVGLTDARS